MNKHNWTRHGIEMCGKWEHFLTVLQIWKCKECGEERPRPDDDSQPSIENCQGGNNEKRENISRGRKTVFR